MDVIALHRTQTTYSLYKLVLSVRLCCDTQYRHIEGNHTPAPRGAEDVHSSVLFPSTLTTCPMGRRTARQSAHSAAVHGGQIHFRLPPSSAQPTSSVQDEGDEDWDVVSVSTEDSFVRFGGGYCQASATLCERHRCVLRRQKNKRAAAWSLECDLCNRLSVNRVQVRITSQDGCELRAKVRCWFADARRPEAQARLESAIKEALVALSARNEEALRRDELSAIAQRYTSADYELSRSSWARRMGVEVRHRCYGWFCAFPWGFGNFPCEGDAAQRLRAEQLLNAYDEPTSARIGRRDSPTQCSARAGSRRSRRVEQATESRLTSRARAQAARTRGLQRRREADAKHHARDLFIDVPAIRMPSRSGYSEGQFFSLATPFCSTASCLALPSNRSESPATATHTVSSCG
jgi:hypothetical protein